MTSSTSPRRARAGGAAGAARRAPRAAAAPTPARTPKRSKPSAPAKRRAPTSSASRALKLTPRRGALAAPRPAAAPILCADTTVALGRAILGKPADAADAARMLALLVRPHAPRAHRRRRAAGRRTRLLRLSVSHVRFARADAGADRSLRRSGEPFDKAGAYAIQGRGRGLHRAHRRQLLRHHGPAAVRDGARCSAGRASRSRL